METRPDSPSPAAFRLIVLGCLAFMALTFTAMALFPGGTMRDHGTHHYHFFDNFFSDLGGTVTPSGQRNRLCMILFFFAMLTAGASVAAFFHKFADLFRSSPVTRRIARIAAILGFISGAGFIGVGVIPWNLNLHAHISAVNTAFNVLTVAVVLVTISLWLDKSAPRACVWIFLSYFVLLVSYLVLLGYGHHLHSQTGRAIQVAGQKVIVYASIAAIGCQAWIADRQLRLAQETR